MSRTKKKEGAVRGKTTNRIINILLVLGCLTILFPLYMTVIIAFKKPSEMTNDVAGALAFPQKWSFENFAEAMRVTDFWHSLGNSLLITGVTVVLCILIHSLAGYLIGRKMKQRKIFKISYYYIVSGMFVPFGSYDAAGKRNCTAGNCKPLWCYRIVCCVFYADECTALFRISE